MKFGVQMDDGEEANSLNLGIFTVWAVVRVMVAVTDGAVD